ncbi:Alpha/Beta hydrolase protein [Thamnocephalis sphaerospora]|uniref:Alpha/Beta hydrolase protein n=1 Tax=Thamnocephalis sphaerospora TaxID=78915 RepID=A0A4P9XP06_9FUNG|nr:Alpha/Beta hydrolase protein [Thamnocephalis sphaerospora]|eukprot:RKP07737.1 Alpha/Beta hydrolase protein [Thamnocephalis sphaerospora]
MLVLALLPSLLPIVSHQPPVSSAALLNWGKLYANAQCGVTFVASTLMHYYVKLRFTFETTPENQEATYLGLIPQEYSVGLDDEPAVEDETPPEERQWDIFSEEEVYRYEMHASYAYCDEAEVRRVANMRIGPQNTPLLTYGMEVLRWEADGPHHFLVTKSAKDRRITLAFRGTSTIADFLANADGRHTRPLSSLGPAPPGSLIYAGMQRITSQPIVEAMDAVVLALAENPGYQLVITGHSLGGTMALLFVLYLVQNRPSLPFYALYTYGEPISMHVTMADWALERIGRERYVAVISRYDIAPRVRTSDGQFGHALNRIVLYMPDPSTRGIIRCESNDDPRCGADLPCEQLSFVDHNWYAGMYLGRRQCLYGRRDGKR